MEQHGFLEHAFDSAAIMHGSQRHALPYHITDLQNGLGKQACYWAQIIIICGQGSSNINNLSSVYVTETWSPKSTTFAYDHVDFKC